VDVDAGADEAACVVSGSVAPERLVRSCDLRGEVEREIVADDVELAVAAGSNGIVAAGDGNGEADVAGGAGEFGCDNILNIT
jgi:hypothetical protein